MSGERWTVDGPQIIDLEHVTSLDATLLGGRVDVVAHDEPERTDARVEVHAVHGRPLEVAYEGATLRIGHSLISTGWRSFVERFRSYAGTDSTEIHVAVPAGTQVRVRTVTGEGLVAGLHDGAYLATVSGALVTSRTRGTLHVDTVSGDVAASEHDGRLELESVSGALTATGALRELAVDSVSGTVTVATRTTPSAVRVNAVSADILVRLPDPDLMDYSVRCLSGRVVVDGETQHVTFGTFTRAALHGVGRPVEVTAASGDVTVLRGADDTTGPDVRVDEEQGAGPVDR